MASEKKFVKFHRQCSPYMSGEVGSFLVAQSLKLVSGTNPIGHYVKKNKKGVWVPENEVEGDEQDGNLEQTGEHGSGQHAETEQEGGEEEPRPPAAKPKEPGQRKRERAKL